MPAEEYRKLKHQFTLQRHFVESSIPHIEAFLRYWIQRKNPSDENLAKLEKPLSVLEAKAAVVEQVYEEKAFVVTAKAIRSYVNEIREAIAKLEHSPAER